MRILIDLQGAQATHRLRGVGRYSLALSLALARLAGKHEIFIALNDVFPDSILPLRTIFSELVPEEHIHVWQAPGPVAGNSIANYQRQLTGECLREAFYTSLNPDIIFTTSLFEGFIDNALTSINTFDIHTPTAVTLYDLIPFIHSEHYLRDRAIESWYRNKIDHLRRARIWLAISESSRQEGINLLNLPHEWVINISAAADARFKIQPLTTQDDEELRNRYRLNRPFIMYTGGIDHRKNIDGLILAYAKLDSSLRKTYQLAIVCHSSQEDIDTLRRLATLHGISNDQIICTGYVSDDDIVKLYNLCEVFIFPSWHEGFGLPVLEAMQCGAAVIGANTTSIPEIIGRQDALFNPHDTVDIVNKLAAVLTDKKFRDDLRLHAITQVKKFSWEKSAYAALSAFEHLHDINEQKKSSGVIITVPRKPLLAYLSPLPPLQSGIANFSADLVRELSQYYTIEVIVDQDNVSDEWVKAHCPIRDIDWFRQNSHTYDRILYHIGSSSFHQYLFDLLVEYPGTIVLHDFFLGGVVAHIDVYGYAPGFWSRALYTSHGYQAVKERFFSENTADVVWKYPVNFDVISAAKGVIVHSNFSKNLANKFYATDIHKNWACIPLLRPELVPTNRDLFRSSLKLNDNDFVICSFGMITENKLNDRILAAWLDSPLSKNPHCHLFFVGKNNEGEYGNNLVATIKESGCGDRIRITGFISIDDYRSYLASADTAIQFRTLSNGESASVLDTMMYGVPTIVNAHGALDELPSHCVFKLLAQFTQGELIAAMTQLWKDSTLRKSLAHKSREWTQENINPARITESYYKAIETFSASNSQTLREQTANAIRTIDPEKNEEELLSLAYSFSKNLPQKPSAKQFLVDISQLVKHDAKSGIQRVVRNILNELIISPPAGYRVEPIYVCDEGMYRYARSFTLSILACPDVGLKDQLIEVNSGDIFLGLDLLPHIVPQLSHIYEDMRRHGVRIYFIIYDLLCITRPEYFFPNAFQDFSHWLNTVCSLSDGVVCISYSVTRELRTWLKNTRPKQIFPPKIGWFHLGVNTKVLPPHTVTSDIDAIVSIMHSSLSILMVGTIEPRKGYAQAVAAFEALWLDEREVNLVIVGKVGWMVDVLITHLNVHPQKNKKLFWLQNADDTDLTKLYKAASGVLMASEGEGFGLPLIEASQYDIPILARDIPIFREIAKEHVCYFSGTKPADLSEALHSWLIKINHRSTPRSGEMDYNNWSRSTEILTQMLLVNTHTNWTEN